MATLVFKPGNTWFAPNVSTITRSKITVINIVDSYTPTESVIDSWDASEDNDGSIMCYVEDAILTIAGNGSGKIFTNQDASFMFCNNSTSSFFSSLISINGLDLFDTSLTTTMRGMFYSAVKLTALDLSSFNTENVTDMMAMFSSKITSVGHMSLTSLDLSNFNTEKVTNMKMLFYYCSSLISITFGENFKVDNVEDMDQMFKSCVSLKSLDLSYWQPKKVPSLKQVFESCTSLNTIKFADTFYANECKDVSFLFYGCSSLKELDLTGWYIPKTTNFKSAFKNMTNLTTIKFGDSFVGSCAEDTSYMFDNCPSLLELDVPNWDCNNVKYMTSMFQGDKSLKTLNVENWGLASCEKLDFFLKDCSELETINPSKWDFGKVTIADSMFSGCSNLQTFSVKDWDTSSLQRVCFMFYGCSSMGTIDFEDWDVSKVTTFDHFMAHSHMEKYDVSKWKITSACENLNAMFHSTKETYIDVTGWDTRNVITFNQLCDGMTNLQKIDGIETWDTSSGVCFAEMFHSCGNLKEINLSSFDTRNANEGTVISGNGTTSNGLWYMFVGCSGLEKLTLGKNFTRYGNRKISSENYAYFPTTTSGYWYTYDYTSYIPNDIPDLTEGTYYSSIALVDNIDVEVKNGSLRKTADAIRTKNGIIKKYKPSEFADAILAL